MFVSQIAIAKNSQPYFLSASRPKPSIPLKFAFPAVHQNRQTSLKVVIKANVCIKTFCNLVQKIFNAIKHFFTSSHRKKENAAKIRFFKSQNAIPHFHKIKAYTPKSDEGLKILKVDAKLFSSRKSLRRNNLLKHKQVAIRAAGFGIPKVRNLKVDGIGMLVPTRFQKGKIIENEILPTCHIPANPNAPEVDHLANAFSIIVDGKERAIIRSGKIDSLQKVKDFSLLLISIRNKIAKSTDDQNFELKVVSNQLNSFEMERNFIVDQHRYLALANKKLANHNIKIVHLNTPTIRFYDHAKSTERLQFLKSPVQKIVFKNSEKLSREQNLEGWGTYFSWIAKGHSNLNDLADEILNTVDEINDLHIEAIKVASKLRKGSTKELLFKKKHIAIEIGQRRILLRTQLLESLELIEKEKSLHSKDSKEYRQLNLFAKILGSQMVVKDRVLHRGHEQLLIQLLNTEMNITASVNCRSGLDRTGFLHSVMVSLETTAKHLGISRVHDMAEDWTKLSYKLNLASLTEDGTKTLLKSVSADEANQLRDAIEFRKTFLTHLLRIGLPITFFNTGYMGFKWQSGVFFNIVENRIPLNFLPSHVAITKLNQDILIPLVRYNKKTGKPLGLTRQGRQLLTKFAEMRGP